MAHPLTGELNYVIKAIEVLTPEVYKIGQMVTQSTAAPDLLAFQGGACAVLEGECCT